MLAACHELAVAIHSKQLTIAQAEEKCKVTIKFTNLQGHDCQLQNFPSYNQIKILERYTFINFLKQ